MGPPDRGPSYIDQWKYNPTRTFETHLFKAAELSIMTVPMLGAVRGGVALGGRGLALEGGAFARTTPVLERVRQVAQQSYTYAVQNPRVLGLTRTQLGTDAEVQATRWLRRWAERNNIDLGPGGLQFQVRGRNSVPDVVFDPARQIFDFKLTPSAVRPQQTVNFQNDFPGYNINYIFGP